MTLTFTDVIVVLSAIPPSGIGGSPDSLEVNGGGPRTFPGSRTLAAPWGHRPYRDKGGLWDRHVIENYASLRGWERDPSLVLNFYNGIRRDFKAAPCATHRALARLEAALGGGATICTQNVDGLHQKAGSRNVIPMHGDIETDRCHRCGLVTPADGDLTLETTCKGCGAVGAKRPNLVWFGELAHRAEEIAESLSGADVFVAIGTSGEVYPSAQLASEARRMGSATLLLNLTPPCNEDDFDIVRYGEADKLVPAWVDEVLNESAGVGAAEPAQASRQW